MKRKKYRKSPLKKKANNGSRFFKYLFGFIILSAVSVFLFLNRIEINKQFNQKISFAKEKITKIKHHKVKTQAGYKKEDRKRLEKLINKEMKK